MKGVTAESNEEQRIPNEGEMGKGAKREPEEPTQDVGRKRLKTNQTLTIALGYTRDQWKSNDCYFTEFALFKLFFYEKLA